jgi:nucleoid DNA-binding protein
MQSQQLPTLLYRYFAQTGHVAIPSMGNLVCKKGISKNDFTSREISPGELNYEFTSGDLSAKDEQVNFLVQHTGKSKDDVQHSLVMLGEALHNRLHQDKRLEWMGVGSFSVTENGEIQFQTKNNPIELNKPVHYQHVIRQNAVHEMRVGEDQRSTTEMEAYFDEQKSLAGRFEWKKGAFVLLFALAAALLVRFSMGSFNLMDGRYHKVKLTNSEKTYKLL